MKYSNIIQIAPGAIKNGFLEKPEELLKSLTDLKNKTFKNTKFIPYIILSLPPNNFYTNILTIPKNSVLEGNIEESIKLNARMLSPIPLETAYLD
jgi:Tfp pilus assembly PilM family ATPase